MEPHVEDESTLRQLREIFGMDRNVEQAMKDAYHLGRIRGKFEGLDEAIKRMAVA